MKSFKVTRIYAEAKGESHFEDVYYPLKDNGPIGFLSDKFKVENIVFRKVTAQYDYGFHNAPDKQFIILLDGAIEIETSSGEVRQFVAGEVLLVEDTHGKGHRTRNLVPAERSSVFITIA